MCFYYYYLWCGEEVKKNIMEKKKKNSSLWCDDGYFEFNSINVQVRRYYDAYMMHRCLRIEINHYWIIYISIWTLLSHSSSFDILFLNTSRSLLWDHGRSARVAILDAAPGTASVSSRVLRFVGIFVGAFRVPRWWFAKNII